jgi:hypothetical protein
LKLNPAKGKTPMLIIGFSTGASMWIGVFAAISAIELCNKQDSFAARWFSHFAAEEDSARCWHHKRIA